MPRRRSARLMAHNSELGCGCDRRRRPAAGADRGRRDRHRAGGWSSRPPVVTLSGLLRSEGASPSERHGASAFGAGGQLTPSSHPRRPRRTDIAAGTAMPATRSALVGSRWPNCQRDPWSVLISPLHSSATSPTTSRPRLPERRAAPARASGPTAARLIASKSALPARMSRTGPPFTSRRNRRARGGALEQPVEQRHEGDRGERRHERRVRRQSPAQARADDHGEDDVEGAVLAERPPPEEPDQHDPEDEDQRTAHAPAAIGSCPPRGRSGHGRRPSASDPASFGLIRARRPDGRKPRPCA